MSQHLTSMFEQLGNFTKNNLTHNSKLKEKEKEKEKENKTTLQNQASPHKQPPPPLKKPCKLRNVASKAESYDALFNNSTMVSVDISFLYLRIVRDPALEIYTFICYIMITKIIS